MGVVGLVTRSWLHLFCFLFVYLVALLSKQIRKLLYIEVVYLLSLGEDGISLA